MANGEIVMMSFPIDGDTKSMLNELAEAHERSMSAEIRYLIQQAHATLQAQAVVQTQEQQG